MENPGLEFSFVQPKATFIDKVRQTALKAKELSSLPVLNLVPDQKEKVEETAKELDLVGNELFEVTGTDDIRELLQGKGDFKVQLAFRAVWSWSQEIKEAVKSQVTCKCLFAVYLPLNADYLLFIRAFFTNISSNSC